MCWIIKQVIKNFSFASSIIDIEICYCFVHAMIYWLRVISSSKSASMTFFVHAMNLSNLIVSFTRKSASLTQHSKPASMAFFFVRAMNSSISSSHLLESRHLSLNIISLLQWHLSFNIASMLQRHFSFNIANLLQEDIWIWFELIKRLIERLTSSFYIDAMNYTTSHRNMTFKEKKIMLQVCRDWIGFSSQ